MTECGGLRSGVRTLQARLAKLADAAAAADTDAARQRTNGSTYTIIMGKKRSRNSAVSSVSSKAKRHRQQQQVAGNGSNTASGSSNPFSRLACASKRQVVLGRRIKGANRDVAKAREKAISVRKQALLQELRRNEQNQHCEFVDNRFGASDTSLSESQRAALRFEAQRSRVSKSQRFNVDSGTADDEKENLTHFGSSISEVLTRQQELDEREMMMMQPHDSDDEDVMDAHMNFGGGGGDGIRLGSGDGSKSRLEIMQEVIAKSKAYKAEKAVQRDEDSQLMAEADAGWADIRSLMKYSNAPSHRDELELDTAVYDEAAGPQSTGDALFDVRARELSLQVKVVASDRKKTDEEVARETKQRLDALEQKRLQRMKGDATHKPNDASAGAEAEDTFAIDPEFVLDSSDDEAADDDDDDAFIGSCLADDVKLPTAAVPDSTSVDASSQAGLAELPFTFQVPESLEQFYGWVQGRDEDDLHKVIQRVIACNHRSLGASNSVRLQRFLVVLLQYFGACCSSEQAQTSLRRLDVTTASLFQLAQQFPQLTGTLALQRLTALRRCVAARLRSSSSSSTSSSSSRSSCYPKARHLLELQLFERCFSCTDFQHRFVTPALLVLGQCLTQLPINGGRDICASLFLCNMLLSYVADSRRLVPELIEFVHWLLRVGFGLDAAAAAAASASDSGGGGGHIQRQGRAIASIWSSVGGVEHHQGEVERLSLQTLWVDNDDPMFESAAFAAQSLGSLAASLERMVEVYSTLPSFIELFQPICDSVEEARHPLLSELLTVLRSSLSESRRQRQPIAAKPELKCIRSLEPAFDENFVPGRDKDDNEERVERRRMQRELKSARRGAKRELRRDAAFIEDERRRVLELKEKERKQKDREVRSFLEQQQRDTNIFQKYKRKAS